MSREKIIQLFLYDTMHVLYGLLEDVRRWEIAFRYLGPVNILCRKDDHHYGFSTL